MKRAALAAGALVVLIAAVWLAKRGVSDNASASAPGTPAATEVRSAESSAPAGGATARPQARPQMPSRPGSPGLEIDLRDPDPKVRRTAVAEVAASDHPDPQVLIAASRDRDLGVAITGTEGLSKLYRDGELPATELIARVTDPGSPERVRVAALNGLGVVASAESAALLVDQLAHGDVIGKRSAAILLQHQDAGVAVPALINALGDADTGTRSNAHDSLVAFARGRDLGLDAAAWSAWWQSRR